MNTEVRSEYIHNLIRERNGGRRISDEALKIRIQSQIRGLIIAHSDRRSERTIESLRAENASSWKVPKSLQNDQDVDPVIGH